MIVYYAAMSLDGRISGPDHDLSFLQALDGGNDYEVFYADVDSLIMGARTWDFIVQHGSWPYAGKPTWIVTHAEELAEIPGAEPVERFAGDVDELVLTVAPALVGAGPALADGEFPTRRFRLAEHAQFGENGVRLRYERP